MKGHHLSRYRETRKAEGVGDATVDREIGYCRAAYGIAYKEELIDRVPRSWCLSGEDNPREGFVEPRQFLKILSFLSPDVADAVEMMLHSGWRTNAVLALRWEAVDWEANTITLPGELAKNGKPVPYPLEGPVGKVVHRRRDKRQVEGYEVAWLFHRQGKPIKSFRRAWLRATERAGFPGLRVHDLRRSLANMHLQADVPQAVTMKLAGWLTDSMYRRYAIVSRSVSTRAIAKAEAYFTKCVTGHNGNGSEEPDNT